MKHPYLCLLIDRKGAPRGVERIAAPSRETALYLAKLVATERGSAGYELWDGLELLERNGVAVHRPKNKPRGAKQTGPETKAQE